MASLATAMPFTSSSSDDDSTEAFANRLLASFYAVQDRYAEAEAYVDYTETVYNQAKEDNLPLLQLAERRQDIIKAVDALADISAERTLLGCALLRVLKQLPEED